MYNERYTYEKLLESGHSDSVISAILEAQEVVDQMNEEEDLDPSELIDKLLDGINDIKFWSDCGYAKNRASELIELANKMGL